MESDWGWTESPSGVREFLAELAARSRGRLVQRHRSLLRAVAQLASTGASLPQALRTLADRPARPPQLPARRELGPLAGPGEAQPPLGPDLLEMGFEPNAVRRAEAAVGTSGWRRSRMIQAVRWLLDHAGEPSIHSPLPAPPEQQPTVPREGGEAWAVIVAGDEADDSEVFGLHQVFNFCCRQLGRERVILIANLQELREQRARAAQTGLPELSPNSGLEQNRRFRAERLASLERNWGLLEGPADYDFERANPSTVLRVLAGQPAAEGDKVLPSSLGALFFCFAGHGGSFRSVPRNSSVHQRVDCDLCGQPHPARPTREESQADCRWLEWLHQDCNCAFVKAEATQSTEHDQTLAPTDLVFTPFGPATVVARQPSEPYELCAATAGGRPVIHRHLYQIEPTGPGWRSAGGGPGWQAAAVGRLFELVAARRCPAGVLQALWRSLGDARCWVGLVRAVGGACGVRRDWMVLQVGPRQCNHFHSSLKTREWVLGMPHPADDRGIFGPVSWGYSEYDQPWSFLAWQHIFEGLGQVRARSAHTKILVLTEACYSGGAIKFLKDATLSLWRELDQWPLFLIATAGEAQQSVAGLLQLFVGKVREALEGEGSGRLLEVFESAVEAYWRVNQFVLDANAKIVRQASRNVRRMAEVHHSFAEKSGIQDAHVSCFFTQPKS